MGVYGIWWIVKGIINSYPSGWGFVGILIGMPFLIVGILRLFRLINRPIAFLEIPLLLLILVHTLLNFFFVPLVIPLAIAGLFILNRLNINQSTERILKSVLLILIAVGCIFMMSEFRETTKSIEWGSYIYNPELIIYDFILPPILIIDLLLKALLKRKTIP